ncbi:hypothetical protein AQI88_12490 [Streptomyces cellostaticus]|uniref:Uncharacterized protein n=1 Tax=Streptomyces cellostaticus TaxID=67285 RepID=A0A101NNN9_9ACTN|nr:hypothetical protein [Streptomyces cellostaticus]KUM96374.1 hypothetical protein AQI88_12490 [Streptomyces cellostaticus]GHI09069.1 hypothetical protein Scel_73900 [Streptomyces cellostaticus]
MTGPRTGSDPASPGLEASWCATGLGDHRHCHHTYACYPYASLPPLDPDRYTGRFDWLGPAGEPVAEQVTRLTALAAELAAGGLTLPQDFVTFRTGSRRHTARDTVSVTGCWPDLSDPLPSPAEPGAALVRFLRDQQDCVLWYLYLRPTGEASVVQSCLDHEYEAQRDGRRTESDPEESEEQRAAIFWCAPSFEEFAHRFWIENRVWRATRGEDLPGLEPQLRDHLRHYAPPEVSV